MTARALICGCSGTALSSDEARFFGRASPWGLILFARNIENPGQVRALTASFRDCVGWNAPVLIDQEGGRVQRLRTPHWHDYPPAARYGELYAEDADGARNAVRLASQVMGAELRALGITIDCLPVLDLKFAETHDVIGDRAYSGDPDIVADLGRAACEGLLSSGVVPIIKHIPGHGRAAADSHHELPVVDAGVDELRASDFKPFRALNDMPAAMTAHILYTSLDAATPATVSAAIIKQVIRGEIGFDGLLMSDDISMKALGGSIAQKCEGLFAAGCDMALHCNADRDEMAAAADATPPLSGKAAARADAVLGAIGQPAEVDIAAGYDRLMTLTA